MIFCNSYHQSLVPTYIQKFWSEVIRKTVTKPKNTRKTTSSYYLGIQLIEYLLVASEFITHQTTSACHLEVKFIDYLLTSSEFITHRNKEVLGCSLFKFNYTRRLTLLHTSNNFLVLLMTFEEFSKVEFWHTPLKDQ